jgi:23S rRNA (guanosine2251-2'-O)-methyltransferase
MSGQVPLKGLRGTALKRFLRDFRRDHPPLHDLVVVLQSVEYPMNVGSIFRIADAARVEELILTGITPTPPHPTVVKVARAKDRSVPWRYEKDVAAALLGLKSAGYRICGLELAEGARPYYELDWAAQTCLVVGHEDHGITKATLAMCDEAVFVPMWGRGLSLNVHISLAVVLFHIRCADCTQ